MATGLAIAIPSVVAVAACLMWALDYSKKAHEIEKLRLEVERLTREERSRVAGLYKPTAEEVDRFAGPPRFRDGGVSPITPVRDRDRWPRGVFLTLLFTYGAFRLLKDVVKLVMRWLGR